MKEPSWWVVLAMLFFSSTALRFCGSGCRGGAQQQARTGDAGPAGDTVTGKIHHYDTDLFQLTLPESGS